MRELIQKKKRKAKITGILSLIFLAVGILCIVFGSKNDSGEVLLVGILVGVYGFIITGIIYLITRLFTSNLKWLRKLGKEHTVEDIDLSTPYIKHGKIYIGREALYSKKDHVMIPYSEAAWIYSHIITNRYLPVPTYSTVVHTKDRKRFTLYCRIDELKEVIENLIVPANPNLVLGYGKKQSKRYKELNPR